MTEAEAKEERRKAESDPLFCLAANLIIANARRAEQINHRRKVESKEVKE